MYLFLKILLFTVLLPGTVAVYLPMIIAKPQYPISQINLYFSIPFFLTGLGIYLWCAWDFASFGKGTPAPIDPPQKLVVHGLYSYSRNPMYVGVLTFILGWVVLNWEIKLFVYGLVVWLVFNLFIVYYEEKHLLSVFGSEYQEYCQRVSRWLSFWGAVRPYN